MAENTNNDLRITTISLSEYDNLRDNRDTLHELVGAKDATINQLYTKINELQEKQPEVKVIYGHKHTWHDEYDGDETTSFDVERVEFTNLTEVERLAKEQAKDEVKEKTTELENEIINLKSELKFQRNNNETLSDKITEKEKVIEKVRSIQKEKLEEEKETYNKNINKLKTAANQDAEEYKETIKGLKEEIKKIKDNKTDVEVEEKRNKEIRDLKGRIKDLEKTIEELGSMNFFKRVFKLRTISAEKLVAQTELIEREKNANKVGTTWEKENGKYSKNPSAFSDAWNTITVKLSNGWDDLSRYLFNTTYGCYVTKF